MLFESLPLVAIRWPETTRPLLTRLGGRHRWTLPSTERKATRQFKRTKDNNAHSAMDEGPDFSFSFEISFENLPSNAFFCFLFPVRIVTILCRCWKLCFERRARTATVPKKSSGHEESCLQRSSRLGSLLTGLKGCDYLSDKGFLYLFSSIDL